MADAALPQLDIITGKEVDKSPDDEIVGRNASNR